MAVAYKQEGNKVTCILVDRRNGRQKKYYGEAFCSPEDTFNLEKGKKIAFNRARLMELGENEAHDKKIISYLDEVYASIKKKFAKRKNNREIAKARVKADLTAAYEE